MDTGNGNFIPLDPKDGNIQKLLSALQKKHTNHGGTFSVGEKLTLKDSLFEIKSINSSGLTLKLLKRNTSNAYRRT